MNSRQRLQLAMRCGIVRWQVDMSAYSSFRTGGTIEAMVESADPEELTDLVRWLHAESIPWQVIGGGSNILFTERQHEGVFIRLRRREQALQLLPVDATGDVESPAAASRQVLVEAGCSLAALVAWCTRRGLGGLEKMVGIPGSVGGAIRMNAGAFGQCMGDHLQSVLCLDRQGVLRSVQRADLTFHYRQTQFFGLDNEQLVILRGILSLPQETSETLSACSREIMARRRAKQPRGAASAGSFFKNPAGDFAGRLIEEAGLKGWTLGRAMVSAEHANFIVNIGGAKPGEIVELMRQVQEKVLQRSGILLEPEVRIF